ILGDVIVSQSEPVFVIEQVVQVKELVLFVLFRPEAKLPLHFADIHRDSSLLIFGYLCLGKSQQTAALRRVAGFPNLVLLWPLRHSLRTLMDCSSWHSAVSLPRSQRWTLQDDLGG